MSWADVRDASTYVHTALTRKFGFKEGDVVSIFSRNAVWYPVVMFAGVRGGEWCDFRYLSIDSFIVFVFGTIRIGKVVFRR